MKLFLHILFLKQSNKLMKVIQYSKIFISNENQLYIL